MAKTDVDRKVDQALKALLAPREDSIRALAQAIDDITGLDKKIGDLMDQRDAFIARAGHRLEDAKNAGWKPKELAAASLVVPKPLPRPAALGRSKNANEPDTA